MNPILLQQASAFFDSKIAIYKQELNSRIDQTNARSLKLEDEIKELKKCLPCIQQKIAGKEEKIACIQERIENFEVQLQLEKAVKRKKEAIELNK